MIKDLVRQYVQLMIAVSSVLFVVWILFSTKMYDGTGVFEGSGSLFGSVVDTGEIKNEGICFIQDEVSAYVPSIKYTGDVKRTGEMFFFKEELQVRKEDGSWVSGSLEDDFDIYLLDIRNESGSSVLLNVTEEEIARMEEIPTAFWYESEQDILCCFSRGIYIVRIKICGTNGGVNVYEFKLPVESS